MKLHRYDIWIIGLYCGVVFMQLLDKEYIGMAINGFILGLYLSVCYFLNNDAKGEQDDG